MLKKQIRNKCRAIKWWFMRANGKVTPDMWWDYKYSLAYFIEQGLDGLLHKGVTDWDAPYHKQEKEDLEFVYQWAKDFPKYESSIVSMNKDDYDITSKIFADSDTLVLTKEEWDKWEKRQQKAFKLLGKHLHSLWD